MLLFRRAPISFNSFFALDEKPCPIYASYFYLFPTAGMHGSETEEDTF